MIQSLTVRDATGTLGAAAGTEAGMILTPWNPDESWTHDALVQVGALLLLCRASRDYGPGHSGFRCFSSRYAWVCDG